MPYKLKTEDVAYWFFRLNGCLNLVNFLVHTEMRDSGTDIDLLAMRFPYRRELAWLREGLGPMQDHQVFDSAGKIDIILAELKTSRCRLNGPWTDPKKKNMHRVLQAIGAFQEWEIDSVATALYDDKKYEDDLYRLRLFTLGREKSLELENTAVVQLTWEEILKFIHKRFNDYRPFKASHDQWPESGRLIFELATEPNHNPVGFVAQILPHWDERYRDLESNMDSFWQTVNLFQDQTLNTLGSRRAEFVVINVDEKKMVIQPQSSGKERPIPRAELENAWKALVLLKTLTRADIRERGFSEANPAYVVSILAMIPGVSHRTHPVIELTYRRRGVSAIS